MCLCFVYKKQGCSYDNNKELLAIRRIFSLVDMIHKIKFSKCPNVFEIGVVLQ